MTYYFLERGWMEHDLFKGEPFSRRDAWVWMIGEAAWKDTRTRIGNHMIEIKRGQFTHSVRFLAEKWKWPQTNVHRFLDILKNENMIETKKEHNQTVITICNYSKYQISTRNKRNESGTKSGTNLEQVWNREEEGKEDIGSEAKASSPKSAREEFILPQHIPKDWWDAFMEVRIAKKATQSVRALNSIVNELDRLQAKGHDPTAVIEQSIRNSWKDVYPIKDTSHGNTHRTTLTAQHPKSQIQRAIEATQLARTERMRREQG